MTTRVYKIVMTPEDTDDRVAYMIDKTDEPPVTEETAGNAFDVVLSDNDGYELESFEEIAESDIPADAHPYTVG
jgi:hypothetical protein